MNSHSKILITRKRVFLKTFFNEFKSVAPFAIALMILIAYPSDVSEGLGFDFYSEIDQTTAEVKSKLVKMQKQRESISIADMFEMQMLENPLSRLSDLSSSVDSLPNQLVNQYASSLR